MASMTALQMDLFVLSLQTLRNKPYHISIVAYCQLNKMVAITQTYILTTT